MLYKQIAIKNMPITYFPIYIFTHQMTLKHKNHVLIVSLSMR